MIQSLIVRMREAEEMFRTWDFKIKITYFFCYTMVTLLLIVLAINHMSSDTVELFIEILMFSSVYLGTHWAVRVIYLDPFITTMGFVNRFRKKKVKIIDIQPKKFKKYMIVVSYKQEGGIESEVLLDLAQGYELPEGEDVLMTTLGDSKKLVSLVYGKVLEDINNENKRQANENKRQALEAIDELWS